MVYRFKGQVKVSEIQSAFDDMIARVNTLREKYTEALGAANYNIAIGGSELGPNRYTLSVGGLKTIIKTMVGTTFGSRVFKYNNTYVVSNGIRIDSNSNIISLPAGIVAGGNGDYVIFNKNTRTYTFSQTRTENNVITTISKVNKLEPNGQCDIEDVLNASPKDKIFCGNNGSGYYDSQTLNSNVDNFISLVHAAEHGDDVRIYFKGTLIGQAWRSGKKNSKYAVYWQHFFLPRGVATPFSSNSRLVAQKIFQVLREGG